MNARTATPPTDTASTGAPARRSVLLKRSTLIAVASWPIALFASFVFLSSLPYKFSGHPDTAHIFSTIGTWMGGIAGDGVGRVFSSYGAYAVGSAELLASLLLLAPLALWLAGKATGRRIGPGRAKLHALGGGMAAALMAGAAFFHLYTPLGTTVVNQGVSDGGALFRTALTVFGFGVALVALNVRAAMR